MKASILVAVMVVALTGCGVPGAESETCSLTGDPDHREPATVERVVDGDTVELRCGAEVTTARLIGINTFETVKPGSPVECGGPEASAFTAQRLTGRRVTVAGDAGQGRADRYGRVLVYLWTADGVLINRELIEQGRAVEASYGEPYRYRADFRQSEQAARRSDRGLWASCPHGSKTEH